MAKNLYKRGGVYWWRAMIAGVVYRRTTGMTDLQMAKRKASEFDKDVRAGKAGWGVAAPTMETWTAQYLTRLHGETLVRNQFALKHVRALWGSWRLTDIHHTDCEAYVASRMKSGASAGTVWLECVRIKHLLNLAKHDDLLVKNPWQQVRLPRPPKRRRVLSSDEEARLRAEIPEGDWLGRLLTVALGTGLRRTELLGLKPCHIENDIIRVPAELAKGHKARSVPLRRDVRAALMGQVRWLQEDAASGQLEALPGLLQTRFFPYNRGTATERIRRAAERAKLEPLTLHDLRRTFATRAANGDLTGTSIPLIHLTRIMGHSSPTVTAQYYVWLQDAELLEQMKAGGPVSIEPTALNAPKAGE